MKCLDCQNAGNGKLKSYYKKNEYICFHIRGVFWGEPVIHLSPPNCPEFEQLIDIGDRVECSYPIEIIEKIKI
jgi:hypothetical protein